MAQKISEVRAELADLQEAYTEALDSLRAIIDTTDQTHNEWHVGAFRNCSNETCKLAHQLNVKWSAALG